jgi:hypothetical protein
VTDELGRKQAALRRHVVKHLTTCCEEAKAQWADLVPDATTPTGAGTAAIGAMLNACAWSIGNTLVANRVPSSMREKMLREILREVTVQFTDGEKHSGEGHMI